VGIEQGTLPGCESAVESQTEAQAKQESETKVGKPRYEGNRPRAAVLAAHRYRAADRGRTSGARGVGVYRAFRLKPVSRRGTSGRRQSGAAGMGAAVTGESVGVWVQ
jgi:hypothetical protein